MNTASHRKATLFPLYFLPMLLLVCWPAKTIAQDSAVSDALRAMFNPTSTTDANTMGLVQRTSFVDRIAGKRGRFEIALVIDGTDSMQEQLSGIQQQLTTMLGDIRRVVGGEVYVQIVIYRDVGAESGEVQWPMGKSFTREPDIIADGLQHLVPQTGAPYFLEAVDQGLYAAITELSWSSDATCTRWLLLIGDAPPFERGFREPKTGAVRQHSTEQLVQLAQSKGIEILAILCPTSSRDQAVYDQVVGLTRSFFGELTSQTGGMMLDLSDPELLANVAAAANSAVSDFLAIAPISVAEITERRAQAERDQADLSPARRARIAVLPHLPVEAMSFSRSNPAVRFADEMRSQLELAGRTIETVSGYELSRSFARLDLAGLPPTAAIRQIGLGVAADYVIWGALVDGDPDKVSSNILDVSLGQNVVATDLDTRFPARAEASSAVLNALATESKRSRRPIQLASVQRRFRTRLVANTEEVERLTLSARGQIADSMQSMVGQTPVEGAFTEAERELEQARKLEPDNPITNSLLANVYFNQYQTLSAAGRADEAEKKRRSAIDFGAASMRGLDKIMDIDQLEVEADYSFYRGDFGRAAELYEQMAAEIGTLNQVRRARWMLAGIYSGDWGISKNAPALVNASKAREQVVELIAFFEDSPEAAFFKKSLLWNERRGETLSANLPLAHVAVPID